MSAPSVTNVKRHAGIAGQFSVTADVTYPGEDMTRAEFVGSTGAQTLVSEPDRFGEFGPEWVRRFFGATS